MKKIRLKQSTYDELPELDDTIPIDDRQLVVGQFYRFKTDLKRVGVWKKDVKSIYPKYEMWIFNIELFNDGNKK